MRGLGLEIAKNIMLQGAEKLSIFDNNIAKIEDLEYNFYLEESDIGKKRRDEAVFINLQKLNPYVSLNCLSQFKKIKKLYKIIHEYNIVILTELTEKKIACTLGKLCHQKNICFIYSSVNGLCSFLFNDFGKIHTIFDENNVEPKKFYIKSITNEKKGLVSVEKSNEYFNNGMHVTFEGIEGMKELNNIQALTIEIKNDNQFYICDTRNFGKYIKGGIVKEVKIPFNVYFKSIGEIMDQKNIYLNEKNNKNKDNSNINISSNNQNEKNEDENNIIVISSDEEEKIDRGEFLLMLYINMMEIIKKKLK